MTYWYIYLNRTTNLFYFWISVANLWEDLFKNKTYDLCNTTKAKWSRVKHVNKNVVLVSLIQLICLVPCDCLSNVRQTAFLQVASISVAFHTESQVYFQPLQQTRQGSWEGGKSVAGHTTWLHHPWHHHQTKCATRTAASKWLLRHQHWQLSVTVVPFQSQLRGTWWCKCRCSFLWPACGNSRNNRQLLRSYDSISTAARLIRLKQKEGRHRNNNHFFKKYDISPKWANRIFKCHHQVLNTDSTNQSRAQKPLSLSRTIS